LSSSGLFALNLYSSDEVTPKSSFQLWIPWSLRNRGLFTQAREPDTFLPSR
jgi:hypothetical protein